MKSIRSILTQTYLGNLYRRDKTVFIIVTLFIAFNLIANFIRLETTPFYMWNMYSGKYPPRDKFDFYEIRYNNNLLLNPKHTWNSFQKMMITEPLGHYLYVKENGGVDPWQNYLKDYWSVKHPSCRSFIQEFYNGAAQYAAYPDWLKRYISRIEGVPIENITILKKELQYEEDGKLTELRSDTALIIK
ncbi:MAG: hypothetical protein ACHQET_00465 [Chitinophagales bacterium]